LTDLAPGSVRLPFSVHAHAGGLGCEELHGGSVLLKVEILGSAWDDRAGGNKGTRLQSPKKVASTVTYAG